MQITELRIMGDSGKEYAITVSGDGSAQCSCPSFAFRTQGMPWCKHLEFAAGVVNLKSMVSS